MPGAYIDWSGAEHEPVALTNGISQRLIDGQRHMNGTDFTTELPNSGNRQLDDMAGFCQSERPCSSCGETCKVLRGAGLRPTRQRMALADLLFGKGDRHISAELLFEEATRAMVPVSLATIYNTLHQFTEAGLLKAISIDSSKTYFDTNTGNHHHFFLEDTQEVIDMPEGTIIVNQLPQPPEGLEITSVDVVVRVRKK
jgi:Fur family iron response transcriptional regulator